MLQTPIQKLGAIGNRNTLFIKREDFLPFSFGGNKARKATLFLEEINKGDYDCIVTYGSGSSNHCRVISNMAAAHKMSCYIISPKETSAETFNSQMMLLFGADICTVSVKDVHHTIENKLGELRAMGRRPYFIAGGGHGNIGTQAYVNCYEEIRAYERYIGENFDYIFHASGTGSTQAGLICGKLINHDAKAIIGISIARKNPMGRNAVFNCVKEYLDAQSKRLPDEQIEKATIFIDTFIGNGYGQGEQLNIIDEILIQYGIPLDATYTGKAFAGMQMYLNNQNIRGKNILFIHTGGTPLFFDDLRKR